MAKTDKNYKNISRLRSEVRNTKKEFQELKTELVRTKKDISPFTF
jgi:septal ring factor EnvC (AmiA/AmiB activator)